MPKAKEDAQVSEETPRHVYIHEALAGLRQTEKTETLEMWVNRDLSGETMVAEIASLLSLENVRVWKDILKKKSTSIQRQLERANRGDFPPSVEDGYKWRGSAMSALRAVNMRLAEAREVIRGFEKERSELLKNKRVKRRSMWVPLRSLACRECDHQILLKEGEPLPDECPNCGMTFNKWNDRFGG